MYSTDNGFRLSLQDLIRKPSNKAKAFTKKRALPNRATRISARPLCMPVLSAKEHDPHVKAYFQHLVDKGKLPLQALCAVMRKLLHTIHGILKHNQPFANPPPFYAIPAIEN
jgi:hypothetical protein